MRLACIALAIGLLLSIMNCAAQESDDAAPSWSYGATGMYYSFGDQSDFLLAVGTADHGSLHLEARHNYEAIDAGSIFVGWEFSGGNTLMYELTPLVGAVFGSVRGIAPGFEASFTYGIADFYSETEYLYDIDEKDDSYLYSWNELGFSPIDWLRFGLVGQRTRLFNSDRNIERGGFAQIMIADQVTLGLYVFNPNDNDAQFGIVSLFAEF